MTNTTDIVERLREYRRDQRKGFKINDWDVETAKLAIAEIEKLRGQGWQDDDLENLNNAATPGIWGQFNMFDGPFQELAKSNMAENRSNMYTHDTSHNMSAVDDGQRYRVGEFKHSADAAFAEALVNAYRSGRLIPTPPEAE